MEPADGKAVLQVARTLNLRSAQISQSLELLEELSVREQKEIRSLLETNELRRVLQSNGSRPARAKAFLDLLRALRRPEMSRLKRRLTENIAAMKLPRPVRVLLPRDLASDELKVEIVVNSAKTLDSALSSLISNRDELKRILAILGGEDEV